LPAALTARTDEELWVTEELALVTAAAAADDDAGGIHLFTAELGLVGT